MARGTGHLTKKGVRRGAEKPSWGEPSPSPRHIAKVVERVVSAPTPPNLSRHLDPKTRFDPDPPRPGPSGPVSRWAGVPTRSRSSLPLHAHRILRDQFAAPLLSTPPARQNREHTAWRRFNLAEAAERRRNRFQSPDTPLQPIAIAYCQKTWSPFPRGMQTLAPRDTPPNCPRRERPIDRGSGFVPPPLFLPLSLATSWPTRLNDESNRRSYGSKRELSFSEFRMVVLCLAALPEDKR